MRKIEYLLWKKYYQLQNDYEIAKDNPLISKLELEQMRDNIDMSLEDLQDEDANIEKIIEGLDY